MGLTSPPKGLKILVEVGGKTIEQSVEDVPLIGDLRREIGIPEADGEQQVTVTAITGESSKSTTITVPPQRKWRIYVAPSAHTDIGYTHVQPECIERHN